MAPDSRVDTETIDIIPDILDKSDETIVRRYVDAHDEELEGFEDELVDVLSSKQLENASADELDRIGRLFGELGRRRGRSDVEYRNYLGSIVQSFGGRGTNPGIKFALGGGINVDIENIAIDENFDDLSDTLVFYDWTPHKTQTLVDIFQLAKPSTVELAGIKYKEKDGSLVADAVEIQAEKALVDIAVSNDSVSVNPNTLSRVENILAEDAVLEQPKAGDTVDGTKLNDANQIKQSDANGFKWGTQSQTFSGTDWGSTDWNKFEWGEPNLRSSGNNWDFFSWTEIIELDPVNVGESSVVDDAFVEQTKAATITDDSSVDDSVVSSTDSVLWESNSWNEFNWANESTLDSAVTSTRSVAWELNSWDEFNWADL